MNASRSKFILKLCLSLSSPAYAPSYSTSVASATDGLAVLKLSSSTLVPQLTLLSSNATTVISHLAAGKFSTSTSGPQLMSLNATTAIDRSVATVFEQHLKLLNRYKPSLKVASAFRVSEINVGDTVSKDQPIPTTNLIPAFEVDVAPFSVVSCLSRELPQLPACLPSIKAASLGLFYPFACPVLGVVPRT